MVKIDNSLANALSEAGYSLTRPRLKVFSALQSDKPISMHELIKQVEQVDRASVYRTIELFERLGIIQRLQIGWKYKLELSDKFSQHHHHAICNNCGLIITLYENSAIEHTIQQLAINQNFAISEHQLEIRGLCENCQIVGLPAGKLVS